MRFRDKDNLYQKPGQRITSIHRRTKIISQKPRHGISFTKRYYRRRESGGQHDKQFDARSRCPENVIIYICCNVAIGWEGCLANRGPQGPIYGQNRQRTASNRLLESHRKQSSNGLQQHLGAPFSARNQKHLLLLMTRHHSKNSSYR